MNINKGLIRHWAMLFESDQMKNNPVNEEECGSQVDEASAGKQSDFWDDKRTSWNSKGENRNETLRQVIHDIKDLDDAELEFFLRSLPNDVRVWAKEEGQKLKKMHDKGYTVLVSGTEEGERKELELEKKVQRLLTKIGYLELWNDDDSDRFYRKDLEEPYTDSDAEIPHDKEVYESHDTPPGKED